MHARSLTTNDCADVLRSDEAIYPCQSPLTKEIMSKWYVRNPDFGLIFSEGSERMGILACVPLKLSSWKELLSGLFRESQLHEGLTFDLKRDKTFALHIYHIERFSTRIRQFHRIAFTELGTRLARLSTATGWPTVAGFSALCTTPEGIQLFSRELGFKETGYVSKEHVVRHSNGQIEIRTGEENAVRNGLSDGLEYVCRCQFLVLRPEDGSELWTMFRDK